MKNKYIVLILSIIFVNAVSQLVGQVIPEKSFNKDNRLMVKKFPAPLLPKDIDTLIITVYIQGNQSRLNGSNITLHGKTSKGYYLLDSINADFIYNSVKNPHAVYKDGNILVSSGMPLNESESIVKLRYTNNKLVFIENYIFDPNAELEEQIEKSLNVGNIKEAAELYLGVQSPPWGYLESAQLILLERAHEVAMGFSKKRDYKKAAETMGYAYDFFTGISEESEIKANSKEAKYIADYTYFLLNIKDYQKCIEVCQVINKLSPQLAGPYLHLGNSLYETGKKAEANKSYEKYIEIRKSKKEENRIPAYVFQRVKIKSDNPEDVVYKFFRFYFDNKLNEFELTNWNEPNLKSYRVNFTATEKYLTKLRTSGCVSKVYIEHWRNYFNNCDKTFLKKPQNEGPPAGFEFDFITNSQENPEKIQPSDFKLIEISGTNAKVSYMEYLVYSLVFEDSGWKIEGVE